jgi:acyl-ACP thioesterase
MPGMDYLVPAPPEFVPDPAHGRVFAASRTVRSTDVTPAGRLRLDALARYLQDVAEDDLADAGWNEPYGWLVRRVAVLVRGYPVHAEPVRLRTFCSAIGPRWAERTTTLAGSGGDLMQARAVWVAVGRSDGRPSPLGTAFQRVYAASSQGGSVSARLSHPGPPPQPWSPVPARSPAPGGQAATAVSRAWPLRASDFDTADHVNNSVHWAAVEDVLAGPGIHPGGPDADPGGPGVGWLPASAELEYRRPIVPGISPRLVTSRAGDDLWVWLLNGTQRLASARLSR